MRSLPPIRFTRSPSDIRLLGPLPAEEVQAQLAAADRAGFERGLIEGERRLSEQLLQQRTDLMELHNGTMSTLQAILPEVIARTEQGLIELAFEVASRVIAEIPVTRELVAAAVREALADISQGAPITVLLHPDDLALMDRNTGSTEAASKITFASSPEVTRGGCLVHTPFGVVDTRRETKLERVAEALGIQKEAA